MIMKPNAAKLRITIEGINPAPWREIEIRVSSSLKMLHDTLQAAFLWQNTHLWEFEVDGKRYGTDFCIAEGDDIGRAQTMRIAKIVENDVKKFTYIYDFGDHWVHTIEILSLFYTEDNVRLPRFVSGEYAAPPENIGGIPGYEYFLDKILKNPKHPERENYEHFINDALFGIFDPEEVKPELINIFIKRIARAKSQSKTSQS